ncbi:Hypothetical predicted protein [Paramuricea clavata]|uniref:Uncharacterized protein n=1 Tax=Paramuricea clavata TaxID=317549 RepID=A0A6S7GTK4_PARCT|nr:Hypothetical predicted protein [Paramuricea clavata]
MSRPPDVYEMNYQVLIGDKYSPCEANYAVIRTTEDNKEEWPVAVVVVERDIFVDDLYTSSYDDDEAITLRKDVTNLMAKGGFPMRKRLSSSRKVLGTIPQEERGVPTKNVNSGELPSGRALGVKWDGKSDNLGIALAHIDRPKAQNTKRGILKRLATLYDQLSWDSPYVVRAKIRLARTTCQWHHIGKKLNIADIASRGTSGADISADSTWIQGPEFFKSEFSEWPVDKGAVDFPEPSNAKLKKSVLKAKAEPAKTVIDPAAYSN